MKTMFPGTGALLLMLDYTVTDPQEPWIALCNPSVSPFPSIVYMTCILSSSTVLLFSYLSCLIC